MVSRLEALMSGDVGGALKQYNVSAFECVRLQLVDDSGEAATAQFAPGYVHQLCGESESISGYSKPSVVLYLHKRSFKAMLSFDYEEKRSVNGSKPSDVPALFHEWMPQGFAHCQPELARLLSHDDGASLPEHCASSSRSVPLKNSEHGRTLALPFSEAAVRHWCERLEILSILFIDGLFAFCLLETLLLHFKLTFLATRSLSAGGCMQARACLKAPTTTGRLSLCWYPIAMTKHSLALPLYTASTLGLIVAEYESRN